MNIMVFDVPAEYGGALSILNEIYEEAKFCKDKTINWIFIVSIPNLQETGNIKIKRFPWIKKSWGHRLFFDNIIAPRLIKKYKVDKVLSLQNVIFPNTNVSQILYVHQPLPFIDYKFTFKENKLFWVYQNLISKKIFKSIQEASKIIVQTEWMKKACVEKTGIKSEKIYIVPPKISLEIKSFFEPNKDSFSTFFYPASEIIYKNHKVIVEACKRLQSGNVKNFKVIFTLKGDENDHIYNLYKEVSTQHLPIEFVGSLARDEVFDYYTHSILLFPSYIETFGLPMLEARMHRGIVIASDCPFSHEILNKYDNAYIFDPFSSKKLAELMLTFIKQEVDYFGQSNVNLLGNINDLISIVI